MRLAEALILRADRQKRIAQLKDRLSRVALIQEGDEPAEDPQELLEELERLAGELVTLIRNINRTNIQTALDGGTTLSDVLAARDVLGIRHATYRELATAASATHSRYSRSEVKYRSTVNVREIQRRADALAQEYRELDARIQETNWSTDLVE